MTDVQTITIKNEVYAVLPIEEFEDMRDIIEADAISVKIANGDEETYPHELVAALVNGENPVRIFRKLRNLTLQKLADKTNLSQPYLSEIETGKKVGSAKTLKTIAGVLGVDLELLI